jgi:cytochrome c biogenesis protein CcmG, thiol:disulfide interchange protein DsbE
MKILLSSLLLALALTGCVRREPLPNPTGAESAGEALSFTVKTWPDGRDWNVADDRGSVVLLDVWATWCEPCKDALPVYAELAKEYGPRGLKVYALNIDEDPNQIAEFLQETKVAVPILVDQNAAVAERVLKVQMMPTTFILDKRGIVRFVHEGFSEGLLAKYQAEIEQLLSE